MCSKIGTLGINGSKDMIQQPSLPKSEIKHHEKKALHKDG